MTKAVWIRAAAAITPLSLEWRGLSGHLGRPGPNEIPAEALAQASLGFDQRSRKMMSQAAWLSCLVFRKVLQEADWKEGVEELGCYLGVGASGSSIPELTSMLNESLDEGKFQLPRFGTLGLAACNPLFAFQLMNNFTLCHAAILEGLRGPNGAFYSRGVGTVAALSEAMWALRDGLCERALAGGSETAVHPVTLAELKRTGLLAQGCRPSEGAAVLALTTEKQGALARLESCEYFGGGRRDQTGRLPLNYLKLADEADLFVLAPWGDPAQEALLELVPDGVAELDVSLALGESLAARPALAWVVALDALVAGKASRVIVLSAGIDGGLGAVTMSRGDA